MEDAHSKKNNCGAECRPRRSSRNRKQLEVYAPTEKIRNQATSPNKRACRRSEKVSSATKRQSTLTFQQQDIIQARTNAKAMSQIIAGNTSTQIMELLSIAVQISTDFPTDVKVEFPRYRCERCKCHFELQHYRKVFTFVYVV